MKKKVIGCSVATLLVLLLVFAGWFAFKYYWVFGDSVAAGELNYITHKGYIFKTYEGRLIQAGYNSKNSNATIQSNEFNFSVADAAVADSLMHCAGKTVELHYKEYKGALPWRGMQKYVVDKIVSVQQKDAPIIF